MSDNISLNQVLEQMGILTSNTIFKPVKTNETAMKTRDAVNGLVYFTTDTQKIYLGSDGKYVPMGGNSGVYYSSKTLTASDISYPVFTNNDITGDQMPMVNDLIINVGQEIKYNGFYRVAQVLDDTKVLAYYLPVGGGGGGSEGGTQMGYANIKYVFPADGEDITLGGETYIIKYFLEATDSNKDPIRNNGTATWTVNSRKVLEQTARPNTENEFNVTPYLDSSRDINEIQLTITINTGGSIPTVINKFWYIKSVDLRLEWNLNLEQALFNQDQFTLMIKPYGAVDCIAHIIFDNDMESGYFVKEIPARQASGNDYPMTFQSLSYGVHSVEMYLTAMINNVPERTESVYGEIAFTKDGTSPFLMVPFYQQQATQYDTLSIPFLVYDPLNPNAYVEYIVNGVTIAGDYFDRTLQEWPYTISQPGHLELSLKCGEAIKLLELDVQKLELDVSEPGNPVFKLKASEFSGNDELRKWSGGLNNNIGISFSDNFDWKNGGLQTEKDEKGHSRKYICVKHNTQMTIDYKLFSNFSTGAGKLFKFIFKATNCYNYEAPVLNCYEPASNVGLEIDAQKAVFRGGSKVITTQFCEDSYIELELEIWPDINDHPDGDRYLMFWVDGIPAAVAPYAHEANFVQTKPTSITIGSPDCDVYVYLIKTYDNYLDQNAHIDNFIVDSSNVEDMLSRFDRNDVLGTDNKISWSEVIKKNPSLPIHLYDIPRMTRDKNDKVSQCKYEQYKGSEKSPVVKCDNTTIRVQGTSSAAYGVAAFNIDSDFNGSMTDAAGNLLKYYNENKEEIPEYTGFWAMRENSIPIDYACTKVNVASCENANNAINQEWYNKFQPYWDAHRRKNPKARDCMEFTPGLMFIKDRNPVGSGDVIYNDEGEVVTNAHASNAYRNIYSDDVAYMKMVHQVANGEISEDLLPFRQYAICNMGNSKKNTHVFHDESNPLAYCVEVKDNQNVEHWMTVKADMGAYEEVKAPAPNPHEAFYEFRYPDKPDTTAKESWLKFENWMAENDPSPYDENLHPHGYTNKLLAEPEYFEPKTFTGFTPPGCENLPGNDVTLAGLTITRYARDSEGKPIEYKYDTKEYRIAKMLRDCETYLVMDSIVYHYLFIERHTMVDNVAKNTFWSTEDGQHWDLTKNYDNDTADGNNNTGYLVYSYGIECMDDEVPGIKKAFNASDSVWFNFIHELTEAQAHLFGQLEKKGAWSATNYLQAFKQYQDIIPERCWVEDYFKKYIRPRRLGLDEDTYLKRLEGGKKTHQRKQYETYQEYYMGSKYEAGIGQSQTESIDIRLNSGEEFDRNTFVPVTTYIDCYPRVYVGGQGAKQRIKRGDIYNVPVGALIDKANDATSYWYPTAMIQTMDNLSKLYPLTANFAEAKKLRKITLGDSSKNYANHFLTKAAFTKNTMLEDLNVANSGTRDGTSNLGDLILTLAKSLKTVNISGSSYTNVQFAEGCLLETAYINGVETFRANTLTHLKTIEFDKEPYDENTVGFVNNIYKNLKNLYVTNCPAIDTYDLVKNGNIQNYSLIGINWTITENTLVDGVLKNIDVLDKLLEVSNNINTATALTGEITVQMDCSVDEYELYQKYSKKYPNLTIKYKVTDLNPAVKLTFKNSDLNNAIDHYVVLASGDATGNNAKTIAWLTSAEGPLGFALTNPIKTETASHTYEFTHYWKCNGKLYYDNTITTDIVEGAIPLSEVIPVTDMIFIPQFTPVERWYNIRFYSDNKLIQQDKGDGTFVDAFSVKYNTKYNGPMKNYYYKAHTAENLRYKFLGWSTEPAAKAPKFEDIENYTVYNNVNFYAYYEEEDVAKPTSNIYFEFRNFGNGYEISLKEKYKTYLQGKITLPLKTPSGNDIVGVAEDGFAGITKITHIYFASGTSTYKYLSQRAFRRPTEMESILEEVHLPEGLTKIGDNCFSQQHNLKIINLPDSITEIGVYAFGITAVGTNVPQMNVSIAELPENLTTLGASAFYRGGSNITISKLPKKLTAIGSNTFAYCPNVAIEEFGTNEGYGLQTIELGAFYRAGTNRTIPVVTFYDSVSKVNLTAQQHAFKESYLTNTSKIEIYNDELAQAVGSGWPDMQAQIDSNLDP